jgi:isoleucyl-tRNA synthetase
VKGGKKMFGFGKKKQDKKQKPVLVHTDYNNWDKDLGFLTLIINRKKNITKNYYISIYSTQLKDTDYLRDEDLEDIILSGVTEVVNELSENYKNYLVDKYFKNEQELIKFVTEEFYVDLTSAAITQNADKIKNNAIRKRVVDIGRQNLRNQQKQEAEEASNEPTNTNKEEKE